MLKYLQESTQCRQVSNFDFFDGIDCTKLRFRLKLKDAFNKTLKNQILNKEIKNVMLTISNYLGYIIPSFVTSVS